MIKNIDHIAIKVSNLNDVNMALENLGLPCKRIEQFDEVGMRIAFLDAGETAVELLEVTDPSSPIANDKTGLHHLGIKIKNIEETFDMMKKSDKYRVQGEIRQGAHSRIFFFRIAGQEDILFECVE
jgi:methylmalonyl-CoA/ethylmalonyl-CoA epimerase